MTTVLQEQQKPAARPSRKPFFLPEAHHAFWPRIGWYLGIFSPFFYAAFVPAYGQATWITVGLCISIALGFLSSLRLHRGYKSIVGSFCLGIYIVLIAWVVIKRVADDWPEIKNHWF